MKIGINASFLRKTNTGIGQYTLNIVGEMLNLPESYEHQFYLYFEDKDSVEKIPAKSNVVKRTIETPFYKRDDLIRKTSWERALLPRQARRDNVEVFFTPYNSASSFPLIRHVITLHDVIWKVFEKDYVNNFRKNIYAKQTFDAVKRANRVITVSEYSKKDIIKYLNIDPSFITVVKNGVAPCFQPMDNKKELFRNLERLHIDFPYLFYMGGFEKRKNVGLLLSAFSKISKNYPNILKDRKLVIAGEVGSSI